MPPIIVCSDGESSSSSSVASESSFYRAELFSKRVRFDEHSNRFNFVQSFAEFRSDLWYSRDDYDDIMEDNWEIVDMRIQGGFRENKRETYRGLEPLAQDKPCYMSAVFAVIQEQERLIRQNAYCAEKISQTSQIMSREDKRVALKHAEQDYLSVYGKSQIKKSKSLSDDKSMASTISSSSLSMLASPVPQSSETPRKVYISPMRRVKRLLSPKKTQPQNIGIRPATRHSCPLIFPKLIDSYRYTTRAWLKSNCSSQRATVVRSKERSIINYR